MPGGEANADLAAERVTNQRYRPLNPIEQILLHEIGVVNGVPVGWRNRRLPEAREIDEMHAVRVLKQRRDPAQALAVTTPAVEKHQMVSGRSSADFVDEAGTAVLEALGDDGSSWQGEGRSVSRRYDVSERGRGIANLHREAQTLLR